MATQENNFPILLKAFIVITLFAFLILAVTSQFAGNYGKDTSEIDDRIGLDAINSTLKSAQQTSETWQQSFQAQSIFSLIAGIIVTGMFNLANTMASFVLIPFKIFGNIMTGVLGVPSIVVNIINVLIIITIVFGIWRLVKTGR